MMGFNLSTWRAWLASRWPPRAAPRDARAPAQAPLLDTMADVLMELDSQDRITGASDRALQLLGLGVDDLQGRGLLEHLYPGAEQRFMEAVALARGDPGSVRQLPAVRLQAHHGDATAPTARINLFIEATRDQRLLVGGLMAPPDPLAPAQKSSGTDRFYRIYHSSPDAILILRNSDQTILDFNEGFTRLLGHTREDAIGREELELNLWQAPEERHRILNSFLEAGSLSDAETVLQTRDGVARPVAMSLRYMEFGDEICVLAVGRDISARLEAESAARRSEAKFAQVFRESPDGIIILRQSDLVICDVNPAFRLGSGLPLEALLGKRIDTFEHVVDPRGLQQALQQVAESGWFRNVEMTFRHASGKEIPALVSGAQIDLDGEPGVLCISKNVSELRHAQEQLRSSESRFRSVFENSPIGILLLDTDGKVFQANRFAADLLDYQPEALDGACITDLVPGDDRDGLLQQIKRLIQGRELICRSERRMRCASGLEIWATAHLVLQRNEAGEPLYCIMQIADITEMKKSQQTMEKLAFYDTLTDLANRRLFNERLTHEVSQCQRQQQLAALLYLDLDQFKRVNDTLGHDCGDLLLRETAKRLLHCVRAVDTVSRTGGDEFTILLSNVESPRAVEEVARRILETLRAPVRIAGHDLVITTSIGMTLIPNDGHELNHLLKNADLAMYRAKEQGRNNYQFFSEDLNTRATRRLRMENELRQGLERGEFELHYQPKVGLPDQTIIGVECLVRWQHPELGLLSPDEFIPIAEESGVIVELGHWIIEEACMAGREFIRSFGKPLSIGVNISARQFRDPKLVQAIRDSLRRAQLDPACLELEITETMLMQDVESASAMVRRLAELGTRLAIDDFGTGYSSLNYLKKFPITTVKVDRSFITDIPASSDDMAITAAVIAMAHKLNMEVVAEGVETRAQLEFLIEHKCDHAQGYLFSKALPFTKVLQLLHPDVHLLRN